MDYSIVCRAARRIFVWSLGLVVSRSADIDKFFLD
jgi:hypothetical protein